MGEERRGGGEDLPAQEGRQRGGRCIFTTLCRGVEKHIIIPLLIKLSCVAACRPVAWDAPFLHGTQSKHRGELSTQEYDAWGATQRQPRFLRGAHRG